MKKQLVAVVLLAALIDAGLALAQTSGTIEVFDMLAPKERRTVDPDWKKINAAQLGTRDNPVRCYMPDGERAYLARLTCPDRSRPAFRRTGSMGKGPFTTILDHYEVTCGTRVSEVMMDMYHPTYIERRAVPGFSIAPPR